MFTGQIRDHLNPHAAALKVARHSHRKEKRPHPVPLRRWRESSSLTGKKSL